MDDDPCILPDFKYKNPANYLSPIRPCVPFRFNSPHAQKNIPHLRPVHNDTSALARRSSAHRTTLAPIHRIVLPALRQHPHPALSARVEYPPSSVQMPSACLHINGNS